MIANRLRIAAFRTLAGTAVAAVALASGTSCKSNPTVTPEASPSIDGSASSSLVVDASRVTAPTIAEANDASDPLSAIGDAGDPHAAVRAFAAWTDQGGIATLAADCRAKALPKELGYDSPLSCSLFPAQSCAFDACFNQREDCAQTCAAACDKCDAKCGDTCDTCKSKCKDDACKAACAKTTASCKDTCLKKSDHCESGDCNVAATRCAKEEKRAWDASGCSCAKKIQPWVNECSECENDGGPSGCSADCWSKVWKVFPKCNVAYCISSTDPTGEIEPFIRHSP